MNDDMKFIDINPFDKMVQEGYNIQCGHMVYEIVTQEDAPQSPKFAFLVKEEDKYIARYRYNPTVEMRMGFVSFKGVKIIPIMIRIGMDDNMLYEMTFNYCQSDEIEGSKAYGRLYMDTLDAQDHLLILFYNQKHVQTRTIMFDISPKVREFISEVNIRLSNVKPWSMPDFDAAKLALYKQFPNPRILWDSLTSRDIVIE